MVVGHMLCGLGFGVLLATVDLSMGLRLSEAIGALVVGTNVGFLASIVFQTPAAMT